MFESEGAWECSGHDSLGSSACQGCLWTAMRLLWRAPIQTLGMSAFLFFWTSLWRLKGGPISFTCVSIPLQSRGIYPSWWVSSGPVLFNPWGACKRCGLILWGFSDHKAVVGLLWGGGGDCGISVFISFRTCLRRLGFDMASLIYILYFLQNRRIAGCVLNLCVSAFPGLSGMTGVPAKFLKGYFGGPLSRPISVIQNLLLDGGGVQFTPWFMSIF